MWNRYSAVWFVLGLALLGVVSAGCQEKGPLPNSFASGTPNLAVLDGRYVSLSEAASGTLGGGTQSYVIMKVKLTNRYTDQLFPQVNKFVLTTVDGTRFYATDSGSSALIGISNDYAPLKREDSREFTVGFRVPYQTLGGVVAYEP